MYATASILRSLRADGVVERKCGYIAGQEKKPNDIWGQFGCQNFWQNATVAFSLLFGN